MGTHTVCMSLNFDKRRVYRNKQKQQQLARYNRESVKFEEAKDQRHHSPNTIISCAYSRMCGYFCKFLA